MNDLELRHVAIIKAHAALHLAHRGCMDCPCATLGFPDECDKLLAAKTAVNAAHDIYMAEVQARERAINEATRLEGNALARACADLRDELDTARAETVRDVARWLEGKVETIRGARVGAVYADELRVKYDVEVPA